MTTVLFVFIVVYLGMFLGELPFLQIDRTGIALLGAIALVALGEISPDEAAQAVHLPTVLLLFSFMVLSAQMRLGGFYARVTRRIAALQVSPPALLAALMAAVAALSAVFSNDIVCLAMAPVLADACLARRLNPVPFLLALACAANVGSAATLIGNPQNMLIGETLGLSFAGYAATAAAPVLAGLAATWAIVAFLSRGNWTLQGPAPEAPPERREEAETIYDPWQTAKGLMVAGTLLAVFLFTAVPREVAALTGAGLLLLSRRLHTNKMLGLVDWELLVLFIGLFVVNHAFQETGLAARAMQGLAEAGLSLGAQLPMFAVAFVASNLVSNVPATMLLLPAASEPWSGPLLALVSTLAGNLLIVGSIANIIVVDCAARRGIRIDWRAHARIGVPVTLATLAIAAAWLAPWMK
ncbi:MAG: anion transporter [Rhodocyclaceae bacterium]|nr:anion transporter [Rhodocyclaceae bacterium]